MSAQGVRRYCQRFIRDLNFSENASRDLNQALELMDIPTMQLMYELALDTGWDDQQACSRVLPILLQNCAIHLADDLADGDCTYFTHPVSQGATTLYTLQQLVSLSLQKCDLSCFEAIAHKLIRVGAAQHEEIATQSWNLAKAKEAAIGLNGEQFYAYFQILSDGTSLSEELPKLGHAYGIANHIANDIHSADPRFTDLPDPDRLTLRQWALDYAQIIYESDHKTLKERLPPVLRHLR